MHTLLPIVLLLFSLQRGSYSAPLLPDSLAFSGFSGGCFSFEIHRFSNDDRFALVVTVDEAVRSLKNGTTKLDVTRDTSGVRVEVLQFGPGRSPFCNDLLDHENEAKVVAHWRAVRGVLRLRISGKNKLTPYHQVSAELEGAVLQLEGGSKSFKLPKAAIDSVIVGGFPG